MPARTIYLQNKKQKFYITLPREINGMIKKIALKRYGEYCNSGDIVDIMKNNHYVMSKVDELASTKHLSSNEILKQLGKEYNK